LCGEREGARERDLERACRRLPEVVQLLQRPEPIGRRDALDRLVEHVTVVGQDPDLPAGLERPEPAEVLEDRHDEPLASHLAVGDQVDAGSLLIADRRLDGVVLRLREVHRAEAARLDLLVRGPQPGRDRVAADDGRRQDRQHRDGHA